ncbi:DUF2804 domain-containing protein [Treponema brennaborense]|uniref:DUF2804 domain-containing protein n=1 Tax=Treponema brennaborense (strain DSM 12168 / CIP 105900 / DD5/3) TaxID=906968 RepID=F4LP53_TREBD|nr:DUF2804 domain-containing protein [Treponema brennaborense]AEE15929.1 hypothetical protein Trebr_0485 [Treponema brennaborense DSM 12168]
MYSREIIPAPDPLIQNGKPIFGTFSGAPKRLDIRGVERPFGVLPMPTFITDLRIRSTLTFMFHTDEYVGSVDFFDAKLFGYAEVLFWNKTTGRKFSYRTVIGPRRRLIPKKTAAGVCISFRHNRYIRVSWDRSRACLSVIFNLNGDSVRPSVSAAFTANLAAPAFAEISAVLPAPTMRRCRAVWFLTAPLTGSLSATFPNQQPQQKHDTGGYVLFESDRTYYKLRTKSSFAIAAGNVQGRPVTFSITSSSQEAATPDLYNENVLFVNGETTPLPPVKLTHPLGINGKWVLQDTESMVDLTFTPISDHVRTISIFILRTRNHSLYGTFDGVLAAKNGEKIILKDFPGIVRKNMLRL